MGALSVLSLGIRNPLPQIRTRRRTQSGQNVGKFHMFLVANYQPCFLNQSFCSFFACFFWSLIFSKSYPLILTYKKLESKVFFWAVGSPVDEATIDPGEYGLESFSAES